MITKEQVQKILSAIAEHRKNYPSDAKHAASLGISSSVYSSIKNGQTEKQLSDGAWITIARKLGVSLRAEMEWKPAKTATFEYVTARLAYCQSSGVSGILCDIPNIGKTYSAVYYVKCNKNAVYIDCSQVKTKMRLIRKIASEFGVSTHGKYVDVYDDLIYYLRSIETPLVVLDEAGDLNYEAFLELKALWNATEHCCAWFMMGADGLKSKIDRNVEGKKVGYTEILSRFGDKYGKVTPDDGKEREKFLLTQASVVARANADEGTDVGALVRKTGGSLRKVYDSFKLARGGER